MPTFLACVGVRRSATLTACVITRGRVKISRRIVRRGAAMAVWGFAVWLAWLGFSTVASLGLAAIGGLCLGSIPAACLVAARRAAWLMFIRVLFLPIVIAPWFLVAVPLVAWLCIIIRCCVVLWVGWVAFPILRVAVVPALPLPTSLRWCKGLQPSACIGGPGGNAAWACGELHGCVCHPAWELHVSTRV